MHTKETNNKNLLENIKIQTMKKNILLWTALASFICIGWALTIPDFPMVVLLSLAVVFCIYAHFRLLKADK